MKYSLETCSEQQLPEILSIFNDAILNSTALYDYRERTMEMMVNWYAKKKNGNYPLIGAFDESRKLLGFATYGPFRVQPAYKYTVEHSVYVQKDARGQKLGKVLLSEIIEQARKQNYHAMVGVIDADNDVSRRLHENAGFELVGILKESGYKFGRWLSASFYQITLNTPEKPVEG